MHNELDMAEEGQDKDKIKPKVAWQAHELAPSSIEGIAQGPLEEWKKLFDRSKSIEFKFYSAVGAFFVRTEYRDAEEVLQLDKNMGVGTSGMGMRFSNFIRAVELPDSLLHSVFEVDEGMVHWPEDPNKKIPVSYNDLLGGKFKEPDGGQRFADYLGKEIKVTHSSWKHNKLIETPLNSYTPQERGSFNL